MSKRKANDEGGDKADVRAAKERRVVAQQPTSDLSSSDDGSSAGSSLEADFLRHIEEEGKIAAGKPTAGGKKLDDSDESTSEMSDEEGEESESMQYSLVGSDTPSSEPDSSDISDVPQKRAEAAAKPAAKRVSFAPGGGDAGGAGEGEGEEAAEQDEVKAALHRYGEDLEKGRRRGSGAALAGRGEMDALMKGVEADERSAAEGAGNAGAAEEAAVREGKRGDVSAKQRQVFGLVATEPIAVPQAVVTRCAAANLTPARQQTLRTLYNAATTAERVCLKTMYPQYIGNSPGVSPTPS